MIIAVCPFCLRKEKNVYEDDSVVAFPPLKKDRLAEGHLLVVPIKTPQRHL